MVKVIQSLASNYKWNTISSRELEEKRYSIALSMAWNQFVTEVEKSNAILFVNAKITLKEIGEKINELIQNSKTRFNNDGKYTQDDIEEKIKSLSIEYGEAKYGNKTISLVKIFKSYNASLDNLLKKVIEQIEFKNRTGEEIYKLHVNLPLEKKRDDSIKIAKEIFDYLEKLIETGKIASGKACAGLVEGTIDEMDIQDRYLNAAQLTIYLSKNIENESIADIVKNINSIGAKYGITYMEPSKSDSSFGKGIVSLRCDFCKGQYVDFDKVSKDHLKNQEALPIVKFLRESNAKQFNESKPKSNSFFTKQKERPLLRHTKKFRDLRLIKATFIDDTDGSAKYSTRDKVVRQR